MFPLPDTVLFPGQVLPLHIFEPRYREMTRDVVTSSEMLLAIALLKPGYEDSYFTNSAPIHGLAGLGKVLEWGRLADGKYNIVVRGCHRVRVISELNGATYRRARLEILESPGSVAIEHLACARDELTGVIRDRLTCNPECQAKLLSLLEAGAPLGEVADMIAAALPLSGEAKQVMLGDLDPAQRAARVSDWIRQLTNAPPVRGFNTYELN